MDTLTKLFNKLPGKWKLARHFSSGDQFSGEAVFTALENGTRRLEETGTLALENSTSITASRSWIWQADGKFLNIFYDEEQPRLYHRVELRSENGILQGGADHLCVADTYTGDYKLTENEMTIKQSIRGPNKELDLVSTFTRNSD